MVGWHRWTLGWGNLVEAPQALCLDVHSCRLSRVYSCTVEDKTGTLRGANISVFFHDLILCSPESSDRHHTSSCCTLHLVDNPGFMSTPRGEKHKPQVLGRNALSFSTLPHALSLSLLGAWSLLPWCLSTSVAPYIYIYIYIHIYILYIVCVCAPAPRIQSCTQRADMSYPMLAAHGSSVSSPCTEPSCACSQTPKSMSTQALNLVAGITLSNDCRLT